MAGAKASAGSERAAEAINEVLEAERRAREAVGRCEADAASLVVAARERARRIQERTDGRISRMRTRCEREVAARVARLHGDAEAVRATPPGEDARAGGLSRALARLAARLTGGGA